MILTAFSTNQTEIIKSLAIFYLLLITSYIGDGLFTCFQLKFIHSHRLFQILMGFFIFYFLVTIVSDTSDLKSTPPIEKAIYSMIYFIVFLFLMRLNITITMFVVILIFILYFIELNTQFYLQKKEYSNKDTDTDKSNYWITLDFPFKLRVLPVKSSHFLNLNIVEQILYYFIVVLVILGFISYGGELKDTLKQSQNITWVDIIMDTNICKLTNKKGFWDYFKIGLGIKI